MMRDYLHREEESIHQFLTNVETIHQISDMALTAAIPVGNLIALEESSHKLLREPERQLFQLAKLYEPLAWLFNCAIPLAVD